MELLSRAHALGDVGDRDVAIGEALQERINLGFFVTHNNGILFLIVIIRLQVQRRTTGLGSSTTLEPDCQFVEQLTLKPGHL